MTIQLSDKFSSPTDTGYNPSIHGIQEIISIRKVGRKLTDERKKTDYGKKLGRERKPQLARKKNLNGSCDYFLRKLDKKGRKVSSDRPYSVDVR